MTDLVVERHGRGRALLFVHGATLDHRMWAPQLVLADAFEVITYDLRGYGRSPAPSGPFQHHLDASALLDELGLRDVLVVGHSIGALYGLELALARPDAVTAFASICMSGLDPVYPAEIAQMFAELRQLARSGRLHDAKAQWARCGWFASARRRPELATLLDVYLADYGGWYWLHDSPSFRLEPPAYARLHELSIPVVVVDGALDLAYNHAIADTLAAGIPKAELVRLPVGHMASLEAAAAVTEAIVRLAEKSPPGAIPASGPMTRT